LGGLLSYYYSSHIVLTPTAPPPLNYSRGWRADMKDMIALVKKEKPFLSFMGKRLLVMSGLQMSAPLVPIYLVRTVHATDSWISIITMSQTAILFIGYFLWTRISRKQGSKAVLLWTTLGISFYPLLLTFTTVPWQIAIFAGFAGIFQAVLDLVFFDELMKNVPVEYSAIFVSVAQMMQYMAAIFAPMIGTLLADVISIQAGLIGAAVLRFIGFLAFFSGSVNFSKPHNPPAA